MLPIYEIEVVEFIATFAHIACFAVLLMTPEISRKLAEVE
jgi:hypothetical protein